MDEKVIIRDCEPSSGAGGGGGIEEPSKRQLRRERVRRRIWEIDALRGFAVFLMVFDHIMFDFSYFGQLWSYDLNPEGWFYRMYELASWYETWIVRTVVWAIVVCIFFGTSGISSTFSRSNVKRGLKLAVVAAVITIATGLAGEDLLVRFGVIHCYAVSILSLELVKWLLSPLPKPARLTIIGLAGFGAGIAGLYLYLNPVYVSHDWFSVFGITSHQYFSADYFPILPWTGVYFLGSVLGQTLYRKKKTVLPVLDKSWCRPVKFIGRHALIIYVVHQVLIFGIFYLTGVALGYGT